MIGELMKEDEAKVVNLETKRLKVKINALLDVREKLIQENEDLKRQIKNLQLIYEALEKNQARYPDEPALPLLIKWNSIIKFLIKLVELEPWIPSNYGTAITREYHRTDFQVFEKLFMELFSKEEEDAVLDILVVLGILKLNPNRTKKSIVHMATVGGKSCKVCLLRISSLNLISKLME